MNFVEYQNGNYQVTVGEDGTKMRLTLEDEFIPEFAENCDVKITNKCDGGCPFCYENCTPEGKHAVLFDSEGNPVQEWLKELKPYTELALNGNDLSHPDLAAEAPRLLTYLKEKKIFTNMTVNQLHFMEHYDLLKSWVDQKLIYGLGVSLSNSTDMKFLYRISKMPNAVLHVIAGIFTLDDYNNLKNLGLKLLILGYKVLGRGIMYTAFNPRMFERQVWLKGMLPSMVESGRFAAVSFDNLALYQLDVKNKLFSEKEREWEQFYQGDDGSFTFYIDAVEEKYAKDSCQEESNRFSSKGLSTKQMFDHIKSLK